MSAGPEPSRPGADAAARVKDLLDAAERVADDIRAQAEADSARHLEERRGDVDRLTDEVAARLTEFAASLREHARAIQAEAESLAGNVAEAITKSLAKQEAEPEPAPGPKPEPAAAPPAPEPEAAADPAAPAADTAESPTPAADTADGSPPPPQPRPVSPEEPLLRATQMAVAGRDRAEIEETLRTEFGVEDPRPIVDEILDPAS